MLLRLQVANFRSFRDRQELSLAASKLEGPDVVMKVPELEHGVLRVAAIYGANASGKSNVLRALRSVRAAVVNSQSSWKPEQKIPQQPFRLTSKGTNSPSTFEVDMVIEGTRFQYGYALDAEKIVDEWLHAYPTNRSQKWFRRQGTKCDFGRHLKGENAVAQKIMRPNSLFLSAAAQCNHAQLMPIYRWFDQLAFMDEEREVITSKTLAMCADSDSSARIESMLRFADLGLEGFDVKHHQMDQADKKKIRRLLRAMTDSSSHKVPDTFPEIKFRHRGERNSTVALSLNAESRGTLAYFCMLGPAVRALNVGGVLCVDELDASLHPLLALQIVREFNDPKTNPKGAQLIFNTHDTNLLDLTILRRDQVWFTEKGKDGASHLYPLTDFKLRAGDNLQRGYLQGRYGAVPFLTASLPTSTNERG